MLYEYLLDTFGTNEPISVSDIKYGGYSRPWIDKELSKLCKSKKIVRYERGIYYIPSQTPFGASVLNPNKIIKYKYIEKCGKINGFYMGLSALNRYGLTTQVPNTTEICTNNETSKLRSVKVGNMSVILRKSRTAITNENVDILSFLDPQKIQVFFLSSCIVPMHPENGIPLINDKDKLFPFLRKNIF